MKLTQKDSFEFKADKPVFYTQVSEHHISGYQVTDDLKGKAIWSLNLGETEKIVDLAVQYTTASTATDNAFILPTQFGQEGALLYKYLDSNMFAVVTQSIEELTSYTVMLINGVTGSVIYQ